MRASRQGGRAGARPGPWVHLIVACVGACPGAMGQVDPRVPEVRLVADDATSLAGARLTFHLERDPTRPWLETRADADGCVVLDDTWMLSGELRPWVVLEPVDGPTRWFRVPPPAERSHGWLEVPTGQVLEGSVSVHGHPLPGARIAIGHPHRDAGRVLWPTPDVSADAAGRFRAWIPDADAVVGLQAELDGLEGRATVAVEAGHPRAHAVTVRARPTPSLAIDLLGVQPHLARAGWLWVHLEIEGRAYGRSAASVDGSDTTADRATVRFGGRFGRGALRDGQSVRVVVQDGTRRRIHESTITVARQLTRLAVDLTRVEPAPVPLERRDREPPETGRLLLQLVDRATGLPVPRAVVFLEDPRPEDDPDRSSGHRLHLRDGAPLEDVPAGPWDLTILTSAFEAARTPIVVGAGGLTIERVVLERDGSRSAPRD